MMPAQPEYMQNDIISKIKRDILQIDLHALENRGLTLQAQASAASSLQHSRSSQAIEAKELTQNLPSIRSRHMPH